MSLYDEILAANEHIDKVNAGLVPVYYHRPDNSEDYFSPLGYVSHSDADTEASALKIITYFDRLNDCEPATAVQWDAYEIRGSNGEPPQLIDIICADYCKHRIKNEVTTKS